MGAYSGLRNDFILPRREGPRDKLPYVAKRGKQARTRKRNPLDLEAIGLVLLAAGVFVVGVLLPALPTGQFGESIRGALIGRVGWAAYALPVPLLVLGGLFLFRRNPRWWPRVLLGYVVFVVGAWGVLMILAPVRSGSWGVDLRHALTGAWGTLAVVPALFVASLGLELILALTPTRLTRSLLRSVVTGVRVTVGWLLSERKRARERAAFHADVALARRALNELDRDLHALSTLYPGSMELERWRSEVRASGKRLTLPTSDMLRDVQADLKA